MKSVDYDSVGALFVTLCTRERKCLLSKIVGTGVLDGPQPPSPTTVRTGVLDCPQPPSPTTVGTGVLDGPHIELTNYGKIAKKYLLQLSAFYDDIKIDSFVIMPNHIHFILYICKNSSELMENGPSGTPVPTIQNSKFSRFISTFKRFCNKEYGKNIWQYRSHDHIIRNSRDYKEHVKYIHENPFTWFYDELYQEH